MAGRQLRCTVSPAALCKRSLSKSQAIVRWHLKVAALDYLTALGGLLLLLSHRGPTLLRKLRGVRSWQSVTMHVAQQAKELLLDMVLAAEALLITITLYQALELWLELSDAILYRGDVARARKMAHWRVAQIAEDFWELFLVWPFLYETYARGTHSSNQLATDDRQPTQYNLAGLHLLTRPEPASLQVPLRPRHAPLWRPRADRASG